MKKNFLPSMAVTGLIKKAYKSFLVLALTLTITLNSFAHRSEPFILGCIVTGQQLTVGATIVSADANTYYHWQYKTATGNWTCFVNGTNNINGTNFTVSNATKSGGAANVAPILTIAIATPALENVMVRVLMGNNADPCVTTSPVWGGDDQAQDETKQIRLHVFASSALCAPNSFACAGNVLKDASNNYYGGFESTPYNATTNVYTNNNFGTNATTTYSYNAGAGNGTYAILNNPYAKNTGFAKNVAPHTGNFQMVVEGSTAIANNIWAKSYNVLSGSKYKFEVWAVRLNTTDPIIQMRITNNATSVSTILGTVDMSSVAVGTWKLVHGEYTATSTAAVTFSIRDGRTGGDNDFALDDICLTVCSNCAPLPLHSLDLKASLQGSNVNLKWMAENEMGTTNFVIERSLNGIDYEEIGSKTPSGPVNTPTEYISGDNVAAFTSTNIIYYRIKALDSDHRFAYSNVVTVRLNKTAGVQVWPNPFGDVVNITYNASTSTKVDVSIVNGLGKVVKQNNYSVNRGLNQISVDGLETLSSGIYFIRITDKNTNEVYIQKISK